MGRRIGCVPSGRRLSRGVRLAAIVIAATAAVTACSDRHPSASPKQTFTRFQEDATPPATFERRPTAGGCGGENRSMLLALDRRTGERRWSITTPYTRHNSPLVLGDAVVIAVDEHGKEPNGLVAVGLDDGRARWQRHLGAPRTVAVGGTTSGSDSGVVVRLREDPFDPLTESDERPQELTAFDATTGRKLWSQPTSGAVLHTTSAGAVIVATPTMVRALDARTGDHRWATTIEPAVEIVGAGGTAVAGDAGVLVLYDRRRALAIDTTDGGIRWNVEAPAERAITQVAPGANGTWWVREESGTATPGAPASDALPTLSQRGADGVLLAPPVPIVDDEPGVLYLGEDPLDPERFLARTDDGIVDVPGIRVGEHLTAAATIGDDVIARTWHEVGDGNVAIEVSALRGGDSAAWRAAFGDTERDGLLATVGGDVLVGLDVADTSDEDGRRFALRLIDASDGHTIWDTRLSGTILGGTHPVTATGDLLVMSVGDPPYGCD